MKFITWNEEYPHGAAVKIRIVATVFCLAFLRGGLATSQEFDRGTFGFGIEAGVNVAGDEFTHHLSDYVFHPCFGVAGEYMLTQDFGIDITAHAAEFSKNVSGLFLERPDGIIESFKYNSRYVTALAGAYYPVGSYAGFTPIVGGRVGMIWFRSSSYSERGTRVDGWESAFAYGLIVSLDYSLTRALSFRLDYCPLLTTTDNLDNLIQGEANDGLSIFSLGIYWNIRARARDTELLELAEVPRPAAPASAPGQTRPASKSTESSTRQTNSPNSSTSSNNDQTQSRSVETQPGTLNTSSPEENGNPASTERPRSETPPARLPSEIASNNGNTTTPATSSDEPRTDEPSRNDIPQQTMPGQTTADSPPTGGEESPRLQPSANPAPASENAPPSVPAATPAADCITTMLRMSDFGSLSDLKLNPQNVTLLVEQVQRTPRNMTVNFELKSSGTVIASSTKQVTVAGNAKWFDANQFIDFNRLDTQLQLMDALPMGEYSVAISLAAERSPQRVMNEIRFHHIDIESVFGKEAASVRYLITTGKASSSMQNSQEIQLNLFGNQTNATDGPRISSCDTPEQLSRMRSDYNQQMNSVALNRAEERKARAQQSERPTSAQEPAIARTSDPGTDENHTAPSSTTDVGATTPPTPGTLDMQPSPPVIIREPATAIPQNVPERERMSYLSNTVRSSMSKALSVTSWMKSGAPTNEKVAIVLAEVYFAFDAAELTEESKQVLDYLARDLVKHPEFVLEIRGFADELGDASYNQMLSQRRADRVVEYLGRRQVSETRIRARGMGIRQGTQNNSPAAQQFNRKAQIILISGK
jgi:outer membrane protein OmpA-like peptidoglycan-associated protein